MSTPPRTPSTPPGAPYDPTTPDGAEQRGPRVTGDELRDLAGLRRSRSDKKIAGVAGGIARHLDIDPIIIRVALVVLIFFGGAGVIVYAACWLIVPVEGVTGATVRLDDRSRAVALVLVGVLAALALLGDSLGSWGFPWPLAIIATVVVLVMLFRGRNEPQAPWVQSPGHVTPAVTDYPPPPASTGYAGYAATYPHGRPQRRGPLLFWYALALVALGVGVLGSIDLAGVDIAASAYPALALITSGVLLVLGAFWGRPGGLILLGLLSAVATASLATVGELDTGRVVLTPTTSSSLQSDYHLDAGEIVIDLREISDPEALDGRTIDLDVGFGRVEVTVPGGVDVTVNSDLGAGDSTVFGSDSEGGTRTSTADGGPDAPTLTLDVTVGLGDIDIIRQGDN